LNQGIIVTGSNLPPNVKSMADFFTKSRTEFWLAQMQMQRMQEQLGNDPLPPLLRQQIATFVSRLNQCVYCSVSHSADVEILGGDVDAIKLAAADLDAAPLDDKTLGLFSFVRKLVKSPDEFGEDDWRRAMESGWRNDELESAIYVAAWFQFMNTIATGNLIPATDKDTALELARSRQKPEMYKGLIDSLERLIGKTVSLTIEDQQEA
jgi:uncharacterized peroxidase-related enzyme